MLQDVLERLVRYARIDTQAARDRTGCPSTPGQLALGRLLVEELRGLGLEDAAQDEHGYVTATLPATVEDAPVIGWLAHLDTSPDAPGAGVEPLVHRGYDGGVIELPRGGTVLDPAQMPELRDVVGHDLVTSSGDTLLGADDKAGMAEIMAAVAWLAAHPEHPRPTIRVGFTPDEEVGEGATLFDVEAFGAHGAYTADGAFLGELSTETFSAIEVTASIEGHDVHPGYAKDKLVHAGRLLARAVAALPPELSPERTSGREGFVHPVALEGTAARASASFIVRAFDEAELAAHVATLRAAFEDVVPAERLTLTETVQYPNMLRFLEGFPEVADAAEEAMRRTGQAPRRTVIRGGTDGSRLSQMGLPTPNLPTGGREYHAVREWASVQDMAVCAQTLVELARVWTEEPYRSARPRP